MRKIIQEPDTFNSIFIVGEAPGEKEASSFLPFVGPEGQYLRDRLRKADISPSDCFITNTVHKQPRNNIYESLSKDVIDEGRKELKRDIEKYHPNLIVAVGAKSLEMLTGETGIFKYRGSVMPCSLVPGYKVLPVIHPGNIFKGNSRYDIVLQIDLRKVPVEAESRKIHYPERDIEVMQAFNPTLKLLNELMQSKDPHAIDIETAGGWMVAYGIAVSPYKAYVIPKELLDLPDIIKAVSQYAASDVPKIFHNALFDVFHNAFYYRILNRNVYFDTMIGQHAAFPTLPKSLAFCASIYTQEPYWKDEGKETIKDINELKGKNKIIDWDKFYIYNGKDCCLTHEVWPKIQEEIDFWQTQSTFDLMMGCINPVLFAQMKGFRVNKEKNDSFAKDNEKAIETLEQIKQEVIGDINVGSHKQLKQYLYEDLDMPKQKKKGKVTTEDKALEQLEAFPTPHKKKIGLIRHIKKYTKRRDFYNLKLNDDGRCRFSLNICGTYTGRFASSKSITGSGFNFQNQPKIVRQFYEPDPGRIFIQMDLSTSEARIVAALCGDERWLKQFDEIDQHSLVASHLYGMKMEEVNPETHRQTAKRVAHASHYLLGWKLLSRILSCSANEAKQHKKNYFDLRPKLSDWHTYINTEVRKTRYIRTCFGRVIQFFGPFFDSMITDAVAAEPQSTSADYLNIAIPPIAKVEDVWFHLQVHDSILVSIPDTLTALETIMPFMKETTEREITVNDLTFVIPCDFEIGYNWKELKKVKDLNNIKQVYESL